MQDHRAITAMLIVDRIDAEQICAQGQGRVARPINPKAGPERPTE